MNELQTVGQEIYKGLVVKVLYTEDILQNAETEQDLFQILFIDEGSVIVNDSVHKTERALLAPVLLCLNYSEPQQEVHIKNAKGFSIFFKPEAVNHGLIGNEVATKQTESETKNYFSTEQLLMYPFEQSKAENPVVLSVNGTVRERLLRMSENIKVQLTTQPDNYWPCRGRSFLLEMLMLLQSLYKIQSDNSIQIGDKNTVATPIIREIFINYSNTAFSAKSIQYGSPIKKLLTRHAFRKITGKSVAAYITDVRCMVAENLLKNTLLPIDVIARRCGFAEESVFAAVFTRAAKASPASWRAQFPNPYG